MPQSPALAGLALPFLLALLLKRQRLELPGVLGMGASIGGPVRVAETVLHRWAGRPWRDQRRRHFHRDRLPDGHLLPSTGLGRDRHALATTALLPLNGPLAGSFRGRCCIWTVHGIFKPRPPVRDQIAKVRWSNATVSRRPTGTSTASSW